MTLGAVSLSFAKAMEKSEHQTRHLFLGNGFSIAAHSRFRYDDLAEVAVTLNPALATIFDRLGTSNFEEALEATNDPAEGRALRAGLVKAIAKVHPYRIDSITDEEYRTCGSFLEQFVGLVRGARRGCIFTTNYDLLLYWTLVKEAARLDCQDGFFDGGHWTPVRRASSRVFYLHGALHLYRLAITARYVEERKLLWRPAFPLLVQVRNRLREGLYPVFVTEGNPAAKITRLRRSRYLRLIRRTFNDRCNDEDSALFLVGHGLAPEDDHIMRLIGTGRIGSVYVGWFNERDRARVDEVAQAWQDARAQSGSLHPLSVYAFDTKECLIWGARKQ